MNNKQIKGLTGLLATGLILIMIAGGLMSGIITLVQAAMTIIMYGSVSQSSALMVGCLTILACGKLLEWLNDLLMPLLSQFAQFARLVSDESTK